MQIYIHRNNQQTGPFTEEQVRAQLAAGTISLQDHVWWQGQQGWVPVAQSPLMTGGVAIPPPVGPAASVGPAGIVPQTTSQLAIWALVFGCLSLLCGLFASIPAIVLGHMGLAETKKNPAVGGRGMALAGVILGYVFTGLIVVYLAAIIVLMAMGHQVQDIFKTIQAQENAALSTNSADQTTNADQPAATPTTPASSDSSSSTNTTTAPDQSTNSATPATNAPDSSTNTAPASQ